jgi:hypothetical protein
MNDNKTKSRPPADALDRLKKAVADAPKHPPVRTWADLVRHGWLDLRKAVIRKQYRVADLATLLHEVFQCDFDEDYLRRLLLAEAVLRQDGRMSQALGRPLKPGQTNSPGASPCPTAARMPSKAHAGGPGRLPKEPTPSNQEPGKHEKKHKNEEPDDSSGRVTKSGQPGSGSVSRGEAAKIQIEERLRRMHGNSQDP